MNDMKKINVFLVCMIAVFAILSCATDAVKENVYTKKAAAYKAATAKVNAAADAAALSEINAQLESELAAINNECEAEYEKIFEEKMTNVDAYRADEDSLKAAQTEYDDLYIERFIELKNL